MKIQTMLIRGITVLVILALCISPVSAINILNEQNFEVLPDYAGMDTETAITTFLAREMKLSDAAVKSRKVRKSSMTCHILLPVLGQNMGQSQIVLESLRQRKNSPWQPVLYKPLQTKLHGSKTNHIIALKVFANCKCKLNTRTVKLFS